MTSALRCGWVVSTTPRAALPPGKSRYPLYRWLDGPQGRSGRVRKISPPSLGFDPRTVQPVASRYTDWTIPAHATRKLSYFSLLSVSFCVTFQSAGIATSSSVRVFSLLFFITYYIWSLSLCTPSFHNAVTSSGSTCVCVCVCAAVSVRPLPSTLYIQYRSCAPTLPCLITHSYFTKLGHPEAS